LLHERLYPLEFLLKSSPKIVRAVLKKNDKAKGKEKEKGQPKQPSDQCHLHDGNLTADEGQSRRNCLARRDEPTAIPVETSN
jgi:hypothetical protein